MTQHFKTSSFTVFPNDLNFGNSLFGGKVLAEIDCEMAKVARSIIHKTGADNVVTANINVDFIAPAHQGDLIVLEADVVKLGTTSMTLKTDVYIWDGDEEEDIKNRLKICSATAVFVALKGKKPFPHGKKM